MHIEEDQATVLEFRVGGSSQGGHVVNNRLFASVSGCALRLPPQTGNKSENRQIFRDGEASKCVVPNNEACEVVFTESNHPSVVSFPSRKRSFDDATTYQHSCGNDRSGVGQPGKVNRANSMHVFQIREDMLGLVVDGFHRQIIRFKSSDPLLLNITHPVLVCELDRCEHVLEIQWGLILAGQTEFDIQC